MRRYLLGLHVFIEKFDMTFRVSENDQSHRVDFEVLQAGESGGPAATKNKREGKELP